METTIETTLSCRMMVVAVEDLEREETVEVEVMVAEVTVAEEEEVELATQQLMEH